MRNNCAKIFIVILVTACTICFDPTTRIVRYNDREVKVQAGETVRLGWKWNLNPEALETFNVFYCGYYQALDSSMSSALNSFTEGRFLTLAYEAPNGMFLTAWLHSPPDYLHLPASADNKLSRRTTSYRDESTGIRYLEIAGVTRNEDDLDISCHLTYTHKTTGEADSAAGGNVQLIVNHPPQAQGGDAADGEDALEGDWLPKEHFWNPFGGGLLFSILLLAAVGFGGFALKRAGCYNWSFCLKLAATHKYEAVATEDIEHGSKSSDSGKKRRIPPVPKRPLPATPDQDNLYDQVYAAPIKKKRPAPKLLGPGRGEGAVASSGGSSSKQPSAVPVRRVKLPSGKMGFVKRIEQPDGTFKTVQVAVSQVKKVTLPDGTFRLVEAASQVPTRPRSSRADSPAAGNKPGGSSNVAPTPAVREPGKDRETTPRSRTKKAGMMRVKMPDGSVKMVPATAKATADKNSSLTPAASPRGAPPKRSPSSSVRKVRLSDGQIALVNRDGTVRVPSTSAVGAKDVQKKHANDAQQNQKPRRPPGVKPRPKPRAKTKPRDWAAQ